MRYEAWIEDEQSVKAIELGLVQAAPRMTHESPDPYEEEPYEIRNIEFESLFLTPSACDCVPEVGRPGMM